MRRICQYGLGLMAMMGFESCRSISSYPDKPFSNVKTRILAHRGGGGDSTPYPENCLASIRSVLPVVNGVEVDLQISKDGTVWLSHEYNLPGCENLPAGCFAETTDNVIVQMDTCNGRKISFEKLETIFAFIASNHPQAYISLDVKIWQACALSSLGVRSIMNLMGDRVIELTQKYKLQNQVMVESGIGSFLNHIKSRSEGIDCYLLVSGDFEKGVRIALKSGWHGVSFEYKRDINPDYVRLIHSKGLKLQLWTLDKKTDLAHAISLKPDFIQTDNVGYFRKR